MRTLGITHSVCETCLALVPAKLVVKQGDVFFEKFCPQHGSSVARIRADVENYLHTLAYVKPAWIPRVRRQCGCCMSQGCGICTRHDSTCACRSSRSPRAAISTARCAWLTPERPGT